MLKINFLIIFLALSLYKFESISQPLTNLSTYTYFQIITSSNSACPKCLNVVDGNNKKFSFLTCSISAANQRFTFESQEFYGTGNIRIKAFKFYLTYEKNCQEDQDKLYCSSLLDLTDIQNLFMIFPAGEKGTVVIMSDLSGKCLKYDENNATNIEMKYLFSDCVDPFDSPSNRFYFSQQGYELKHQKVYGLLTHSGKKYLLLAITWLSYILLTSHRVIVI